MNESPLNWIDGNVDKYPVTTDLYAAAKLAFPSLDGPELATHLRESARRAFAHADELRAVGAPANQNHPQSG